MSAQVNVRSLRDAPREDDGYFGPDSVTWKVFADPSLHLGGVASVLLQALEPGMMLHFDKVSIVSESPEAGTARFQRTGDYLITIAFADKAHADAASAHVDKLHTRSIWTDPVTGVVEVAKVPGWQQWTHNTFVWGSLHGALAFGLELTPEEQDRFVLEQHKAAELLHVPGPLPATRAELDAYIEAEGKTKALTAPAAKAGLALRHPARTWNPITNWLGATVQDAILSLLPAWALEMYALEGKTPARLAKAGRWGGRFMKLARGNKSIETLVAESTAHATEHPYQKVRAKAATASA